MVSAWQVISFSSVPQDSPPARTALGLHTHRCAECGNLRPCYSIQCGSRLDTEKPWICSDCLSASEGGNQ